MPYAFPRARTVHVFRVGENASSPRRQLAGREARWPHPLPLPLRRTRLPKNGEGQDSDSMSGERSSPLIDAYTTRREGERFLPPCPSRVVLAAIHGDNSRASRDSHASQHVGPRLVHAGTTNRETNIALGTQGRCRNRLLRFFGGCVDSEWQRAVLVLSALHFRSTFLRLHHLLCPARLLLYNHC